MRYYDFGAGKGNSMVRAGQWWGGTGIGFEMADGRRAIAVGRGHDVRKGKLPDVIKEIGNNSARYSVINHVLEHFPNMGMARDTIKEACRVSTEFVYVAGPWFDSDRDLMLAGCKWFCNDWPKDHPQRVTMLDLHSAFVYAGNVESYTIWGRDRIESTSHKLVYPLCSNSEGVPAPYEYDEQRDGKKPIVNLPVCYSEMCCIATIKGNSGSYDYIRQFQKHNPNAERILTQRT